MAVFRRTSATAVLFCVVIIAASATSAAAATTPPRYGYDISFPQCGGSYPAKPGFGIVGVGGGKAFSHNPCLSSEWRWAAGATAPASAAFYMNTGNPGSQSTHWNKGGPRACNGSSASTGCAYDYGWQDAADAFSYAVSQAGSAAATGHGWWLDVETANSWSSNKATNLADINGALAYLRSKHVSYAGIYSTGYQWGQVTGGATVSAPDWVAGASSAAQAPSFCGTGFSGGPVTYVQYPAGAYDGDYRC